MADWHNTVHVNTHEFPDRMDPDWDAPWRQPADLLPTYARCECCLYWFGICGLDTRKVKREEDRCPSWEERADHAAAVSKAVAGWTADRHISLPTGPRG